MSITVLQALQGLNSYPFPSSMLAAIATRRGLTLEAEATGTLLSSGEYRLACADLYMRLSVAPNISQGGQSYSFSEDERKHFRAMAQSIYEEEEDEQGSGVKYGYKGSRL